MAKGKTNQQKFLNMLEVHESVWPSGITRWLAAHLGALYDKVEQQEKEIRRLNRLAKKVTH